MVAGAGVRGQTQLAHAGKGEDGVLEEAAVGEEGEEGVDDGGRRVSTTEGRALRRGPSARAARWRRSTREAARWGR